MVHTTQILSILVSALLSRISELPNVVGIELINEPQPSDHKQLESWYTNTIHKLRSIDPELPVYISDCWRTDQYTDYVSSLQSLSIIGLDHHLYRCFTQPDISTPISQHTQSLRDPNASTPQLFARASSKLADAGASLIIGEWSGAVNPGSLQGLNREHEIRARQEFVDAELQLFEQHCSGWFFWTYRKESSGDMGWSLRDAVDGGVFPHQVGLRMKSGSGRDSDSDEANRKARMDTAQDKALCKGPIPPQRSFAWNTLNI